jgi:HEAT repeat protein
VTAAFLAACLALVAAGVALTCMLVSKRVRAGRRDLRRHDDERRLRPAALAIVDGEGSPADALCLRDARVVSSLLARYARNLDGTARLHIGGWFEDGLRLEQTVARLGHRSSWRRAVAAHELGDMSSLNGVEPLVRALSDPSRDVRAAAARSLGRLGGTRAVGPLIEALVDATVPRAVAGQALIALGSDGLPALRACTASVDPEIRRSALDLVGVLGTASDAALCATLLRDTSADVRVAAATALGRLGAAEAVPALVTSLEDRLPAVRAAAAAALGQIGDPSAVPALLLEARSSAPGPAHAAARAVLNIDPSRLLGAGDTEGGSRFLREAADLAGLRAA